MLNKRLIAHRHGSTVAERRKSRRRKQGSERRKGKSEGRQIYALNAGQWSTHPPTRAHIVGPTEAGSGSKRRGRTPPHPAFIYYTVVDFKSLSGGGGKTEKKWFARLL